jgi:hypothetical protein
MEEVQVKEVALKFREDIQSCECDGCRFCSGEPRNAALQDNFATSPGA